MSRNNAIMTKEDMRQEAYRLYQLEWMAAHGYSLQDLVLSVIAYHNEGADFDDISSLQPDEDTYNNWVSDSGFSGTLWACKDEFLDAEYQDADYMKSLLPEDLYDLYRKLEQ